MPLGLRLLTADDFAITDDDIFKTMRDMELAALAPRPYGTFNSLELLCTICGQDMQDIMMHLCNASIACAHCGEIHPIQIRGC